MAVGDQKVSFVAGSLRMHLLFTQNFSPFMIGFIPPANCLVFKTTNSDVIHRG